MKAKPIWFTPGIFVDEELHLLAKQRDVVDRNDFNFVDEGYPSTGGGRRLYFVPTYGRIEGVLPDHRLLTCALSPHESELEGFALGQTFLMGKKRTMFQVTGASQVAELIETEGDAPLEECQPVQVNTQPTVSNWRGGFLESRCILQHGIGPERVTGGVANGSRMGRARRRESLLWCGNRDGGDHREPMKFTFLPHALEDMEEREVTEEWVRATVEEPDFTGEGDYGRFVADRRFGRSVVRVVYNVGHGEYVIVAVMRRRRIGGGGGP